MNSTTAVKNKSEKSPSVGVELYQQVRAGFTVRGTSFSAWCLRNKIAHQNARMALIGGWTGPKARNLVARLCKAAGIE